MLTADGAAKAGRALNEMQQEIDAAPAPKPPNTASGQRPPTSAKAENKTQAGYEYEKHMKRGDLPKPPGKASPAVIEQMGKDLLDNIMQNPNKVVEPVTGGKFDGGTLVVREDGIGAVFDANGDFQYFGKGFRYNP